MSEQEAQAAATSTQPEPTPEQEAAHLKEVDVNPAVHRATSRDEERVLAQLYGEPTPEGVYTGAPANEEEQADG